ncbi:response regulator transcription factor [Paenibacillus sp. Marseille-Q4541]|uniref:response regulator transcription factor n=1 Tax=Paenibacillus sp. Marseille-Q4541 TaxID=2831522 RepID=UPI001BA72153|nr:response regulator transcription factor [Paenibacillus sp. Marseille-Q4541]
MPKQAEELVNKNQYPYASIRISKDKAAQLLSNTEEETVPFCAVTKRILLVSPVLNQVHDLVKVLTDRCFDVMMFHRLEPELYKNIPHDLLIYDVTAYDEKDALDLQMKLKESTSSQNLFLVSEKFIRGAAPEMLQEELLVWPGRPHEALYHVQRIISRAVPRQEQVAKTSGSDSIVFKDLRVDMERMLVHKQDIQVHLTKTEYDLLLILMNAKGSVISREEMLSRVWETDFTGGSNVVDVHIKSLRKKLGDQAAAPKYIITVRGVGYRLAD